MQKIKDFETFAAGYFLGLGIKKPTAEDICRLSVECRAFAAALSFYMFTDPYVLSKLRTPEKYEAVAKNIERFTPAPSPHFHQKAFTCRRPHHVAFSFGGI